MCNENNNKNQLKVNCYPGLGHPKDGISSQNGLRNTIQVINNRAQYFADIAKNCLEEVRTILAQVREYAAQNTNVTVEFVTNKIAELRNIIETNLNNYLLKSNLNTELVNFGTNAEYVNETRLVTAIESVIPSQENNENKLLSTDGEDLCWVPVHHDFSIFDIVPKDHILSYSETKGFAQLGSYVYKEAVAGSRYGYPDFYAKVIAEYQDPNNTTETISGVTITVNANGHKFYDIADKADIDSLFTTKGEAWFYGIDTTNERIFLPRNKYLTSYIADGQKPVAGNGNPLGTMYQSNVQSNFPYQHWLTSGGDSGHETYNSPSSGANYGSANQALGVTTDPDKSGLVANIANADNGIHIYMVVGNVSGWSGMTDVVNQGMTILEQVNQGIQSRILLDGSNAEFPYITETYVNGTSWYRVYSDGWCEQGGILYSGEDVDLTVTFLKPYKNTNYIVDVQTENTAKNQFNNGINVGSKTLQGFIMYIYTSGGNRAWQASGYIN